MPKLNAIQFWVWSFLNFESQSIEYFFGLTETQIDLYFGSDESIAF